MSDVADQPAEADAEPEEEPQRPTLSERLAEVNRRSELDRQIKRLGEGWW
ncbi:hypothetical protein [Streptomyces hainanensis]|nr:hypothetical protein [Streptomyces hainanensis]